MRSENVKVRLFPEEKEHLTRQAEKAGTRYKKSSNINLSEYIRDILFRESHYSDWELKKLMRDTNYELRKIGVNVNQIAHKFNGNLGTREDLAALQKYLRSVENQLNRLEEGVERAWQSQN